MGENSYVVVDRATGELTTSTDSAAGELFVDRTAMRVPSGRSSHGLKSNGGSQYGD